MNSLESDKLRLTDFMDLPTLQEIQDSFAAVANVKATITDADGKLLTQPTPTKEFLRRQNALAADEEKLTAQGVEPGGGTPDQLRSVMRADFDRYGTIIRKLNIKADEGLRR